MFKIRIVGFPGWLTVPLADNYSISEIGVLTFTQSVPDAPRPISRLIASYASGMWQAVARTEAIELGAVDERAAVDEGGAGDGFDV